MLKSIKRVILVLTISFNASGMQSDDPYVFVKEVASATFAKIKQDQTLVKNDPQALRNIVEQQLMPHVDHVYAALSVLGTQAKDIPRDKLDLFFEQFKFYLLTTYSNLK
jgi:phospholipid transport system substrate-binding protein